MQYIDHAYPLMILLLFCSDIVATSVENQNIKILIRSDQQ